ncbi:MAG: hypothetical protein IMW89_12635 [Ktedonobacteraceae bacterium]|nr:hypothetical protein [Ktedonobacteraceae bacterium]
MDQPDFWIATIASIESPCLDTRPFALHQLLHTATAETGARAAISGLGGHLLLGALLNTAREQSTEATESDILTQYRKVISRDPPADSPLWSAETAAVLHEEERWEETLHARKLARQAAKFSDSRQGYYYLDLHLRLPDLVVNPLQQLAIQERLVVRSPYLNPHMLEMLTCLPAELEDGTPKTALAAQLLRRHLPDSVASPLPLIAPAASLSRIEDSELLQQTLSAEALQATGIFDVQAVEALLRRARGKAASRELLLVFTTQLLYRLFEMTKE